MATYKVIQDIEAEDKLVGPLTLRQFIYAGVAAICIYISFLGITKGVPYVLIVFVPIALIAGFFAFPFTREQPTEVWALAKIRFLFKARRRIWDQSGVKELVTITAPKHVEVDYTNRLTEREVRSRLTALADTIDSRGWSVKNVNVNLFSQPSQLVAQTNSDRLIDPASLPQDVPTVDVSAADDMLDPASSPVAQQFDRMIRASDQERRRQITERLQSSSSPQTQTPPPNDYWFLNEPKTPVPGMTTFASAQVIAPGTDDSTGQTARPTADEQEEEQELAERLRTQAHQPDISTSHLHTIQPLSARRKQASNPMTQLPDSVKMRLASSNDRSVASLAHEANQEAHRKKPSSDEVIISLH